MYRRSFNRNIPVFNIAYLFILTQTYLTKMVLLYGNYIMLRDLSYEYELNFIQNVILIKCSSSNTYHYLY